ncbi:ArsR/SmtB family transcription factor [Corynebacterium diphtheriae]|uniref:Plasmid replication protein n=2 Tax=Corynebacterium diphtheriae TaxID=1717 RepID=Q6NJP5_CORDI|nr:helix-turn-helix transcriptional regulator [Corynebacterium diphtheriae]AEX78011.1 hypothetical protein CDHC03_0280 [Corynebacterium diphtheriae HC03]AEX80257.1 hypothetical protein CDHC04_0264 [Corynebacterium diphtheriae HC04]AEX82516.1 hypothetical protein CDVA01_0247 [Corynebacterium diphtheriae VA01]ARB88669.1 transcriptional regulator [Corynebacterium diphtheriae]KJJ59436.1 plasmid replication protein [Corynebacterium diphtheriae]
MSSVTAPRLDRATMGRKGGQKAAERWKTDPESDYATAQRETLAAANKRGARQGTGTRGRVLAVYSQTLVDTGEVPTARQIAGEIGITKRMVNIHLKELRDAGLVEQGLRDIWACGRNLGGFPV